MASWKLTLILDEYKYKLKLFKSFGYAFSLFVENLTLTPSNLFSNNRPLKKVIINVLLFSTASLFNKLIYPVVLLI